MSEDPVWLQITAGRGPQECMLFVQKLQDYLLQECHQHNLQCEIIEQIPGTYSHTLLSTLVKLKGQGAKQLAKEWSGTMQWICKSPYRPKHGRKNWFVGIEAYYLSDREGLNLAAKDLKYETFRASGAGGQNVNKVETAVRLSHVPSGLSVTAQEERSQYLNKKLAYIKLCKLLESGQNENQQNIQKGIWQQHNELERGNPVKVFEGKSFRLKT